MQCNQLPLELTRCGHQLWCLGAPSHPQNSPLHILVIDSYGVLSQQALLLRKPFKLTQGLIPQSKSRYFYMIGSAMRCFYGKGATHLCSIPIFYDKIMDFVFWCSGVLVSIGPSSKKTLQIDLGPHSLVQFQIFLHDWICHEMFIWERCNPFVLNSNIL